MYTIIQKFLLEVYLLLERKFHMHINQSEFVDNHEGRLRINPQTNLLEMSQFEYSLQDVENPNLYRTLFSY